MQRTTLPAGRAQPLRQHVAGRARGAQQPFTSARTICKAAPAANGNGAHHANGNGAVPKYPSAAQTIRTIVDVANEGTLCSVSASGIPVGIPVTFTTDKTGAVQMNVDRAVAEMANLSASTSCSLTVQATTQPARAVASVTLVGKADASAASSGSVPLSVEHCLYFGGLDMANRGQVVSSADYLAAEPDVLRKAAPELVNNWNTERAEDIYRIVSNFLGVPLVEMSYAELLWVDYLGMYIRSEVAGKEPEVVRVPFYRPVLDERDARSVITMAAQIAWEKDRAYTPPVNLPGIYADAAAAAASNN